MSEIKAETEPSPGPESEYPTDNVEVFMTACLAANADDTTYCTNLWAEIQGGEPDIPHRTGDAASATETLTVAGKSEVEPRTDLDTLTGETGAKNVEISPDTKVVAVPVEPPERNAETLRAMIAKKKEQLAALSPFDPLDEEIKLKRDQLDADIAALQDELDKITMPDPLITAEVEEKLRRQILEIETRLSEALKLGDQSRVRILELSGENRGLSEDIRVRDSKITNHQLQVNKLQREKEAFSARVAALTKQLSQKQYAYQKESKTEIKDLNLQIDELRATNLQLRKENLDVRDAQMKSDRRSEQADDSKLKVLKESAAVAGQLVTLQRELSEKDKTLSSIRRELAEKLQETRTLRDLQSTTAVDHQKTLNLLKESNRRLTRYMKQSLNALAKSGKILVDDKGKVISEETL